MENKTKNILFRLGLGIFLIATIVVGVLLTIGLFQYNATAENGEGEYIINIIGLIGVLIFVAIEMVMLLNNLTKQIIFHPVVFNEHNSTINWPAFIVANIGLAIGIAIETVSLIFYFTNKDVVIITSVMVLIPIGMFLIFNCIAYDVYVLMFKVKKVKMEDLID